MKINNLLRICKADLPYLRHLYTIDKRLHASTRVMITHFIERFHQKPDWEDKVDFWTLNKCWRQTGTFAMVNKNDNHIFFNTLEPWPYVTLHRTLQLLNYDLDMVFIGFRDIFRTTVLDVIRVQNLEITFDSSTKCLYLPRDCGESINIKPTPEGHYFDSLNESHVDALDCNWSHQFNGSREFLRNCITENPSTGLFNKNTGELVAWVIIFETGACGNVHVLEEYVRNGFGELTYANHISKVSKLRRHDIVCYVTHQNKFALALSLFLGYTWTDNNSWIGVRSKEPLKLIPLWGNV